MAAGRAPYDPAMLVALLLYAYARGNRSSRRIERACLGGCGVQGDHEHADAGSLDDRGVPPPARGEIAELFDQVLGLCEEAGLVSVGVIMIDGTKIKANASMDQNRSYSGVVREILREAEETDRREDELYGDARGDELPEQLRTAEGRKAGACGRQAADRGAQGPRDRPAGARAGRRRWIPSWCSARVAGVAGGASGLGSRAASSSRGASARQSRSRAIERTVCFRALGRLEENHRVDLAANEAYERWRSSSRDTLGRVLKGNSKPYAPPEAAGGADQPV